MQPDSSRRSRRAWTLGAGQAVRAAILMAAVVVALKSAGAEAAEAPKAPAVTFHTTYKADVLDVVSGGVRTGARYVDDLILTGDADLDSALGWKNAQAHVGVINAFGGQPNALVGAVQAVDNIEAPSRRVRLYEAWIEQRIAGGKASLRAGIYDLNSEFYATDSSGLLLAQPFGLSTEIADTGPRGAPQFPTTSLGARLRLQPRDDVYVQVAVVNALAGTVGDPTGLDTSFSAGALVLAEAGWTGRGKLALGGWRYTRRLPDLRDLTVSGDPVMRISQGAYLLADQPLTAPADGIRQASAFLRLGVADGDTAALSTGGQAGVLIKHVWRGRPDSQLSLAASWARFSPKFRANSADAGAPLSHAETTFELTYSDLINAHLALQPDIQYVHRPSGDPSLKDAVIVGLRTTIAF